VKQRKERGFQGNRLWIERHSGLEIYSQIEDRHENAPMASQISMDFISLFQPRLGNIPEGTRDTGIGLMLRCTDVLIVIFWSAIQAFL